MFNTDKKYIFKMTAFWVIVPCGLFELDTFRGVFCLHHQGNNGGDDNPDDEGSTHL
jgi:hypothetical protein